MREDTKTPATRVKEFQASIGEMEEAVHETDAAVPYLFKEVHINSELEFTRMNNDETLENVAFCP